jgi:urea transport system permease protein
MNAMRLVQMVALLLALLAPAAALAQADDTTFAGLADALAPGNFRDREAAATALTATEDPRAVAVLQALLDGDLQVDKASGKVLISSGGGAIDPLTGAAFEGTADLKLDRVKVNNGLRRVLRTLIGRLTLMSDDRATRLNAAQSVLRDANPDNLELLATAIAAETDPAVRGVMETARAAITLKTDAAIEEKVAAVESMKARGGRDSVALLTSVLATSPDDLKPAIQAAIDSLNQTQAAWGLAQNVWYGLSLGSVLLLAAIGLAITFGVMGVINMAHGEMVMLGAYTTFAVQEIIRRNFPAMLDYSLAIALPLAFLVTALIGIAIERGIIRWLYGRALETLLATWGLSLIIQQAIRTGFGPTNKEVANPSWMSGSFELGGLSITWNRFWIVIFAITVFLALLAVLNRTPLGLQMRAVTSNRRMASAMGIRTPFVDAMTFGLGSGIAGLAGVALSQIDNVSPNLGQNYIIDSFMVVVFGGVGNLWGTLVGALSIGVANKFLEPYAGAVVAKIVILVLIVLFIQRRPRGLFALKGRAVES